MKEQNSLGNFLDSIIEDINNDINKLYCNSYKNKYNLLNHLKDRILILENFINVMNLNYDLQVQAIPQQNSYLSSRQYMPVVNYDRSFNLEELSRFNGKNGNPAYVAVNGVVYDVTNNAAWAAATHFGLSAGNDLTDNFNSCHAGSNILSKLPIVGKLN